MNIALGFVDADWILFLNAGDCLEISLTDLLVILEKKKSINCTLTFDWLVNNKRRQPNIKKFRFGSVFSHQAAIISSDQFANRSYNEKYLLAADYEFFMQGYLNNVNYDYVPQTLSSILPGGISDTRRNSVYYEFLTVQNSFGYNKYINYLNFF